MDHANLRNVGTLLFYRRSMLRRAASPHRSSLNWSRAFVLTTFLCCLSYYLSFRRHEISLEAQSASLSTAVALDNLGTSGACFTSAAAKKIVVSVKTGGTEASLKIPTQMQTTLRCVDNILLFSDLEQDIGKYHLHDTLNDISPSTKKNNSDFKFYHSQKQLWQKKHNIDILHGARNPENENELAAWTLDKYKNIHMLEKTWEIRPDMDWYVFIDADTYLLWQNLVTWLATMNPNKKSYFGSAVTNEGTRFAHGGSGIIISKAAMQEIAVSHNGTAAAWEQRTKEKCCGDLVLGLALLERGIELQDVWPSISGESQRTMPFGPGTPEYWCGPAFTLHHLTLEDMVEVSEFERQRSKLLGPLSHAELFKDLLLNSIPLQRDNWDNLASDRGEFGLTGGVSSETRTFEECSKACELDAKCFQYSHHGNACNIGMSVRLGYEKKADSEGIWRSGWHNERMKEWLSKQPQCGEAIFPTQN